MKGLKKASTVVALALVACMVMGLTAVAGVYYPIFINDEETDLVGEANNGVTQVCLRALAEKLGFDVEFVDKKIILDDPADNVKITTLAENNNGENTDLEKEFGFSVIIERGDDKILFDTAKAGQFLKNAEKLDIDLSDCDAMVLSHAHYDHCGGVMDYYNAYGGDNKTLFVKDSFFENADAKYYHDTVGQKFDFSDGTIGYFPIGIDFSAADLEEKGVTVEYMEGDSIQVADGITVYGNFTPRMDEKMTYMDEDGKYVIDDFDEEVAIAVESSKGLVIISGCSHNGIVNIVNNVEAKTGKKVYAVIGGFHLLDATEEQIQETIDVFKTLGVERIGLSHCTGAKATEMFREQLGDRTFVNVTGSVVEVK